MMLAAWEIHRSVAVLVDRVGKVTHVVVGEPGAIELPSLRKREAQARLSGWRGIVVHPGGGGINRKELVGLARNRLDVLVALDSEGPRPAQADVWLAHLLPEAEADGTLWRVMSPMSLKAALAFDFTTWLTELESSLAEAQVGRAVDSSVERAVLVGVQTPALDDTQAAESMAELAELARTAGAEVLDQTLQRRRTPNPATHIGSGKVEELALRTRELGATMVVMDTELSPSQQTKLEDALDLKVIDRTQLILDIFAQRAQTREGKLQVELAQLKYNLPRLRGVGLAMSRLGGGIGTRGPGETKLETDRRRIHQRVAHLEAEVDQIKKHRSAQRKSRTKRGIPQIAIMGYTNAGKSTLLNRLTRADVLAENKLFATLDPVTRRLRLPGGAEVLLTDTVGFIQRLPTQLVAAFRATLEEVTEADVLLHVLDASHPNVEEHVRAVQAILEDLEVGEKPYVTALNKVDQVKDQERLRALRELVPMPVEVSALTGEGLLDLLAALEAEARVTPAPVLEEPPPPGGDMAGRFAPGK
ncbi:MAG: GTPase HflX [Candidatus Sericytochromatia bacterium]|nr:GTPase HflX [Candidatus Sericytochromatia bacterium]